jgi:hypothetical protein
MFFDFEFRKNGKLTNPDCFASSLCSCAAIILVEFTERDIGVKREIPLLVNPESFVSEKLTYDY